ncbi:MAG: AMP-binding protein, partial [Acidimicrobiales bacterium]
RTRGHTTVTPVSYNLADLFERVARRVPSREAIVCGDHRCTYRRLDERADRVAAALAGSGVAPGERVAIALRNSIEYLELMLGAFKSGAVPINVNYRYQTGELGHVLDDSGARLLVHEPELSPRVDALDRPLQTFERGAAYEQWLADAPGEPPAVPRSGDDHYILYTGGTTGAPKGVVWRHEDIFFAAMGGGRRTGNPIEAPDEITDVIADPPNRVLPASPLMHGTAHWFAFLTLFAGSCVVLSPAPTYDPTGLLDLVDAESVSYLVVVGDAFAAPLADAVAAEPDRWDLTSLTVVVSGGAALSAPVRRTLLDLLPWVMVVDSYGTSETGGQASLVHSAGMAPVAGPPRFEAGDHTVVLDDTLSPVEPGSGTVGRVARRGHIPLGYLGDQERTAATFPTVDGERWAITGDQAMVDDDGQILLLGRGSATINSGGEKIHPEEIEAVLREHPAVYDAVVVGLPDDRWGERVAAVVAVGGRHDVSGGTLADHCRINLASYKTPRTLALVDRIRRTESGKPDYAWAQSLLASTEPPS